MTGLRGALCAELLEQSELGGIDKRTFDDVNTLAHMAAKQLCLSGCPAFDACGKRARALQAGPVSDRPIGTWAGVLYGAPTQPRRYPREHGTERGWGQHRYNGEKVCDPCRLAHNAHIRNASQKAATA